MNDSGAIVLNASIAGIKGFPAMSVYSATKAAARSFARTWTNDLRDRRIRVNSISPGHIDTPIIDWLQQGEALARMEEEFAKAVPPRRMGKPDEIAKAVSFLASDEASYISGIELFVDDGVDKFKTCINVLSESKLQAFYALTPLKNPPRCPVSIMTATPSSSIGMR